jgi:hypothetical protein
MRVELTGDVFRGRCEVRTPFCRACVSGSVAMVRTAEGRIVTTCGACLEEMADTGQWEIVGSRPEPQPLDAPALASVPR